MANNLVTVTHRFKKGEAIDCRAWIWFEKVREEGRFVWYRFTAVKVATVDSPKKPPLELPALPLR